MRNVQVVTATLTATIEIHTIEVLVYWNELAEPEEAGESQLAAIVQGILSDLCGDYDLGGTIRAVDVAGSHGRAVNVTFGYSEIGGTWFRVARIELPLIVDDSAVLVP
jgi:hypothetical protein